MVKLTIDIIMRSKPGYTKKKKEETVEQYLHRLTHLHLDGKNLDEIGDELGLCNNLSVLYVYDNALDTIPNLSLNRNLTHLYLQNNNLSRITNLQGLGRLLKLYLGHNSLTVLEGLDKLDELMELHIEHQNLPPGEKLLFDTRSMNAVSKSLQVLDITGNDIDSIRELDCLTSLHTLIARDNNLFGIKEITAVLRKLNQLTRLDLTGNPICTVPKYRDHVILGSMKLETLDGKDITKMAKDFVLNWYATRDAIRKKNGDALSRRATMIDYTHHPRDLPPMEGNPGPGGYVMPGLKSRHFDEILAKSATILNHSPSIATVSDTAAITNRYVHSSKSYATRLLARKSLISINLELPRSMIQSHPRYQPMI